MLYDLCDEIAASAANLMFEKGIDNVFVVNGGMLWVHILASLDTEKSVGSLRAVGSFSTAQGPLQSVYQEGHEGSSCVKAQHLKLCVNPVLNGMQELR